AFADHHMAGRAGAGFLAGVLDVDTVREQVVAQRLPPIGFETRAFGTEFGMRENGDGGHKFGGRRSVTRGKCGVTVRSCWGVAPCRACSKTSVQCRRSWRARVQRAVEP